MDYRRSIANNLWQLSSAADRRVFMNSLEKVPVEQEQLLLRLINRNKKTHFGKEHNFEHIDSIEQYQSEVPLSSYEDYSPYIKKIMGGEEQVLTEDRVMQLHLSSGTSSASKLLPFTPSLQREFEHGLSLWLGDLFLRFPKIKYGSAYWVFTPMQTPHHKYESSIHIGFDQDEDYFRSMRKRFMRTVMAVPPEVQHIADIKDLYYVTLLFLLSDKDLRWISVWNPSFISLLLASFSSQSESLITDLGSGTIDPAVVLSPKLRTFLESRLRADPDRAKEIKRLWSACANSDRLPWTNFWPNLVLISCWADAWAENEIPEIKRLFPGIIVQGKGLLATEGYITLPFHINKQRLPAPILAVTTHFFEFINSADNKIYLAHQLQEGQVYEVIITTGGGLYRYRLYDLVRVEGYYGQAPCLRFLGKTEMISDVRGEKLNNVHVQQVLALCFSHYGIVPNFYFIAPEIDNNVAKYVLFIEGSGNSHKIEGLLNRIDQALCDNFHYAYCRRLGQLTDPACFILEKGSKELYIKEKTRQRRLATLKIACLDKRQGWSKILPGSFAELHRKS